MTASNALDPAVPADLDCYGFMYDPFITPCRDTCELRLLCKKQVAKNVAEMGEEKFRDEERRIVEKTINSPDDPVPMKPRQNLEVQYSEMIVQILDMMSKLGLQIEYKQGYVAAKMHKRNILGVTRAKTASCSGVVKFIQTRERDEFPVEILQFISEEKSGQYLTCTAPDLKTLQHVLETYLNTLQKK